MVAITRELVKKAMPRYKRHDDLIVIQEAAWEEFKKAMPIPVVREENNPFSIDEDELASLLCQTVQKPACRRLAVERSVKNNDYRTPNVELILGDSAIVTHKENQITYRFDITKCMFSFGNINEKMRMAEQDCSEEIVVDLFAGIGYFTLPLLIHAKAKHVYACEWNPDAIDALKRNLTLNKVDTNRCTIIEGDNRLNRPTDVAQRVVLGILPSCLDWMRTAFECIDKSTGAMLHCHDLVEARPSPQLSLANSLENSTQCDRQSVASQSSLLFSQSVCSSSSSHSTIEKLSAPSDEKTPPSESDKDSSSPVLLERPSDCGSNESKQSSTTTTQQTAITIKETEQPHSNLVESSSSSSQPEDSIISEPPQLNDHELTIYETRAQVLIDCIRSDVDSHDLKARLVHIQAVKSYAPHIKHVVFDIKIEPKLAPFSPPPPSFHPDFIPPTL